MFGDFYFICEVGLSPSSSKKKTFRRCYPVINMLFLLVSNRVQLNICVVDQVSFFLWPTNKSDSDLWLVAEVTRYENDDHQLL